VAVYSAPVPPPRDASRSEARAGLARRRPGAHAGSTQSTPATEVDGAGRRAWCRAARAQRGARDEPLWCPRNMAPLSITLPAVCGSCCRPPLLHSTRARLPPQMVARRARPPSHLHGCMQHSTRRRFDALLVAIPFPLRSRPPRALSPLSPP